MKEQRVIIASDTSLQGKLKGQDRCFLSLGACPAKECKDIFCKVLEKTARTVSAKQLESVVSHMEPSATPLYASLLGDTAAKWLSKDEINIPGTVDDIVSAILERLSQDVHPKVSTMVLGLLASARHGLSDAELVEVLSQNESITEWTPHANLSCSLRKCPFAVWALVRDALGSFLQTQVVGGYVLNTWRGDAFRTLCCVGHLASEAADTCMLVLADYFQSCSTSGTVDTDGDGARSSLPWTGAFSNRRRQNELPYYCLRLAKLSREKSFSDIDKLLSYLQHGTAVANGPAGDTVAATALATNRGEALNQVVRHQFLLNLEWLQLKVGSSDPYFLIEEIEMYLEMNPEDAECQTLRDLIQLSSYALRYDGRQFAAQVVARLRSLSWSGDSSFPRLHALYESARRSPSLVPVSNYLRQPGIAALPTPDDEKGRTLGQLYTIGGDAAHMVSLHHSDLYVWDVVGESVVRQLTGVTEPRDLKMVDRFRALVLCNRELKVYSLDEGCLVVKLKGVMNQKMAYFGLHSQDYVVALSRNRMYVNMLNLNSGDLETTFKVGEDR